MKILVIFIALVYTHVLYGQTDEYDNRNWEVSTALSYGSENNIGNPGVMLNTEYTYQFHRVFSGSAKIGFFHSLPLFPTGGTYLSFSGTSIGFYLNHTARFNEDKNFVRLSAGPAFFHSNSLIIDSRARPESYSRVGYGLALEGGKQLSHRVTLGFLVQIYSYDIFGDIIVLGFNTHFRL